MMKDIPVKPVEGIAIAIVPSEPPEDGVFSEEMHWEVFLLNLKQEPVENVLVASKGYGEVAGEEVKTSTLRHYYEEVPAGTFSKVEGIQQELTQINHEFWVSFTHEKFLYDRKYTFVRGSIDKEFFVNIPVLGRKGVMIA